MDAATKRQDQVAGLGAMIRDSQGNFIAATKKHEGFYEDVLAAKAKAIQLRIEVVEIARCIPLIIESDCQEVVDLVT